MAWVETPVAIAAPVVPPVVVPPTYQPAQSTGHRVAWGTLVHQLEHQADEHKLRRVNTFFNQNFLYRTDWEVWGQEDYWATPEEFMAQGAGDCEDFAIAKYATLVRLGIPADQLRLMYVRLKSGAQATVAHMVLAYTPMQNTEPLVLDNLITSIRPITQRKDLVPVLSFNSGGLWQATTPTPLLANAERLSQWQALLQRMQRDGWTDLAAAGTTPPPSAVVGVQVALFQQLGQ